MPLIAWLVLCLIWGSTWLFIKFGLEQIPPVSFAVARFVVASVILFVLIKFKEIPLPRTRDEWRFCAITGFLQFSINYATVFWSEQYISSGLAAVLQATIPLFGLFVGRYFLPDEKIHALKIVSLLLGASGVAIVFYDQLSVSGTYAILGCIAIVIGAFTAALSSVMVKSRSFKTHPAALLLLQMIFGLPALVIYAASVEAPTKWLELNFSTIFSVFYLAIVGTIAAFWLYYWLLSKIESTNAMMIALVTPIIAIAFGAIFLNETLPPQTYVGGFLVLASVFLIVLGNKRKRTVTEEV